MRFVIQVVSQAEVTIHGESAGRIGKGLMVLVGIGQDDDRKTADRMIKKMLHLRIFGDENGKTNLDLASVDGSLLLVSQFTLYADCRRGNRPGFTYAAPPALAEELYDYIVAECRKETTNVQTGKFGADMQVSLVNDGPFTVILDSDELTKQT